MEAELQIVVDGAVVRMIRDEWMMTQARFADLIGVSREWVVLTEKSESRRIRNHTLQGIARAMGKSPREAFLILSDLNRLGFERKEQEGYKIPGPVAKPTDANEQRIEKVKIRRIPYFHLKLPAGRWTDAVEARTAEDADGTTVVDEKTPTDAFALLIEGDCMEPDFPSGSIVVFAPCRPGDHGLQFESGKVYYFQNADGQATFKRVIYEPQRERFRLESLNPKYKPFYVPEQMLARMSRAVRVVRDLI